jgi:lactate dehydrogenase-like 2-hydroxyacid dehydrogenase
VVDEEALIRALRQGQIAGAALDVFEGEPAVRSELLELPQALLIPHLGSATVETRRRMAELACFAAAEVLEGGIPVNCLNPAVFHDRPAEG